MERRELLARRREGERRLRLAAERLADRRLGQLRVHAAGAKLAPEPRGSQPPRARASLDPTAGELRVVEVAARLELGDESADNVSRRATAPQAGGEIAPTPRFAGEQIQGGGPRRLQIQDSLAATSG